MNESISDDADSSRLNDTAETIDHSSVSQLQEEVAAVQCKNSKLEAEKRVLEQKNNKLCSQVVTLEAERQ